MLAVLIFRLTKKQQKEEEKKEKERKRLEKEREKERKKKDEAHMKNKLKGIKQYKVCQQRELVKCKGGFTI